MKQNSLSPRGRKWMIEDSIIHQSISKSISVQTSDSLVQTNTVPVRMNEWIEWIHQSSIDHKIRNRRREKESNHQIIMKSPFKALCLLLVFLSSTMTTATSSGNSEALKKVDAWLKANNYNDYGDSVGKKFKSRLPCFLQLSPDLLPKLYYPCIFNII